MRQLVPVLLPILSIELGYSHTRHRRLIQTAHVDAVAIGVGTRHVERFDAANFAKKMLGDFGVEGISRQMTLALK